MGKQHITLSTSERKKLTQFSKRKLLSHKARQQIEVLLILDKKSVSINNVAQIVGVSTQTLYKWKNAFLEKKLDSLLVNTEKYSETNTVKRGKVKIVLVNIDSKSDICDVENKDSSSEPTNKDKNDLKK